MSERDRQKKDGENKDKKNSRVDKISNAGTRPPQKNRDPFTQNRKEKIAEIKKAGTKSVI